MLYGEERDEGLGLALLQTMLPHTPRRSQLTHPPSPESQPVAVRRWGGKMYDAFERGEEKGRFFLLPSGGGVRQEIGYAIFICRRVIAAFALPVRARIAWDWK